MNSIARALRPSLTRRLAAAAFCASIAAPLAANAQSPERIRIAVEGARPPYNQLDSRGEPAGFEVDLGRALCAKLSLSCQFVQQDWDQLVSGLVSGGYEAVMSAMAPTPERRALVDFGAPYVRMPQVFAGPRGRRPRPIDPDSLAGRTIGVEDGSPQETWLEDAYKASKIRPYASLEEAMLDMAAGRLDVVVGPKDAVSAFIETRREARCCRILADAQREATPGESYAMAFRKSDAALRARFDAALAEALADGAYEAIRKKYFAWPIY